MYIKTKHYLTAHFQEELTFLIICIVDTIHLYFILVLTIETTPIHSGPVIRGIVNCNGSRFPLILVNSALNIDSYTELWYFLADEQALQQTVVDVVNVDTMTLMWRQCNGHITSPVARSRVINFSIDIKIWS